MTRSAARPLARAICATFAESVGPHAVETTSEEWASITFSGERHRLAVRLTGAGAPAAVDAFLHGIEEREFTLPGHIVADVALVSVQLEAEAVTLVLEVLTIAD